MKNMLKLRPCLYMLIFKSTLCHYSCIEGMLNEDVHNFIHLDSTLPLPLCLQRLRQAVQLIIEKSDNVRYMFAKVA